MAAATKASVTKAMKEAGIPGTIWYSRQLRDWYVVDSCEGETFWATQRETCLFIVRLGAHQTDRVIAWIKQLINSN